MKLIIIDKKKTGVFMIIVGLMLVLFCLEVNFEGKLKLTSLIQNNISSLKLYNVTEKNITYKLPGEWATQQEKFSGGELIYHNRFISNKGDIHGYVDVWNLRQDLKIFLEQSREISKSQNIISGYKLADFYYNDRDGFKVVYSMTTKAGDKYKAYEYFIKCDESFIRFAFYVNQIEFKENMPMNFETIVKAVDIRQQN
ncbi:MAG: hypothetical protein H7Y18_18005 [Clostridiaceae bacterium]|nr:hypothetical protein [Clostridiaceae bacterium]